MICLGNGWCFLICFYLNLGGESHILLWGKVWDYLLAQLFPTEKIFTGEKAGYYLSISLRRLQPVALGIRGGLIWCSLFLHLACLVGGSLAAQRAPETAQRQSVALCPHILHRGHLLSFWLRLPGASGSSQVHPLSGHCAVRLQGRLGVKKSFLSQVFSISNNCDLFLM